MPKFYVRCVPAIIEGEFEADDNGDAIDAALEEWITSLGTAADSITAGSFDVRLVSE